MRTWWLRTHSCLAVRAARSVIVCVQYNAEVSVLRSLQVRGLCERRRGCAGAPSRGAGVIPGCGAPHSRRRPRRRLPPAVADRLCRVARSPRRRGWAALPPGGLTGAAPADCDGGYCCACRCRCWQCLCCIIAAALLRVPLLLLPHASAVTAAALETAGCRRCGATSAVAATSDAMPASVRVTTA